MKTGIFTLQVGAGASIPLLTVTTHLYSRRVKIVYDDIVVADHDRLTDKGKTRYDWVHIPAGAEETGSVAQRGAPLTNLPEALQRLRRGLLRENGGDRITHATANTKKRIRARERERKGSRLRSEDAG